MIQTLSSRQWRRYLWVAPLAIVLAFLTIFPLIYSFRMSLYDYYLVRNIMNFAWFKNYIDALSDKLFLQSFWVNIRIAVVSLIIEFLVGLGLALACQSVKKGRGLIVALLTTPILVSTSATGWAFRLVMMPEYGPMNWIIGFFTGKGWVRIDWFGSTDYAIWALTIASIWRSMPFVMLILLAGLSAINQELYEAARIDGASSWQLFRRITLPLLSSSIVVAFLLRMIELIKLFDLVYLLTAGGPARSTESVTFYVYTVGLRFFRVGYGSALSVYLLLLTIALTAILLRVTRRREA